MTNTNTNILVNSIDAKYLTGGGMDLRILGKGPHFDFKRVLDKGIGPCFYK